MNIVVTKKNTDKKIAFDNDIVISSIMFDTIWAEKSNFLPTIKKRFNAAIIPAWHHIYTWRLKVAWYKWLATKTWNLSMVFPVSGKWISLYTWKLDCLWKDFGINDLMKLAFDRDFDMKLSEAWFEKLEYNMPYPRVLWDYKQIFVFRVWDKTPKKILNDFFDLLYNLWNLVFVSDLHSELPLDECTELDEDTVNWKKDIIAFNWFFSLANSKKKKARFVWYINSADINWNDKSTTGFCTMVF